MLDLRALKDRWTEEGAREVFASLVGQLVHHEYGSSHSIRPSPGDDGIDIFVGDLGEKGLRVWQAKYFHGGIGDSQKSQIRSSFKSCVESDQGSNVVLWTLCIPSDMSVPERRWWENWRKRTMQKYDLRIELWDRGEFIRFYSIDRIRPIFNVAFDRTKMLSSQDAKEKMQSLGLPRLTTLLPENKQFIDAIFVQKLELAEVNPHKPARIAFYNFELVRTYVEEARVDGDQSALEDLLVRVLDRWDTEFNACEEKDFGPRLYARVKQALATLAGGSAEARLKLSDIHRVGAIHYWADLCEAGWIRNFKLGIKEHEESTDSAEADV